MLQEKDVDRSEACGFAGSTLVTVIDRYTAFQQPIAELVKAPPMVAAYDEGTGHVRTVRAGQVFVTGRDRPTLRVCFEAGGILECVPDHPLMLADGTYRAAEALRPGDALKCLERPGTAVARYAELPGSVFGHAPATALASRTAYHLGEEAFVPPVDQQAVARVQTADFAAEVYGVTLPKFGNLAVGAVGAPIVFVRSC